MSTSPWCVLGCRRFRATIFKADFVRNGWLRDGKAKNLSRPLRNYCDVFAADNVNFRTIALTQETAATERLFFNALAEWRSRGLTGHGNESLPGIAGAEAERVALAALDATGIPFELPGSGVNQ